MRRREIQIGITKLVTVDIELDLDTTTDPVSDTCAHLDAILGASWVERVCAYAAAVKHVRSRRYSQALACPSRDFDGTGIV